MKKTFSMLLLALYIIVLLSSCASLTNSGNQSKETIKFDLEQYEKHGELSCGLIWVEKTDSDWNKSAERKFAYLDANGNVISPWFSRNTYRSARNFRNGYVILIEMRTFEEIYDYANCVVYDTQFKKIASLNCHIPPISGAYITDFDNQGYAYALGYDEQSDEEMLYWIDSSGAHKFEMRDRLDFLNLDEYDLQKFKVSNDFFVVVSGSSDPQYLYTKIAVIYDHNGKFVFDIEGAMKKHVDDFAIIGAEVLSDNTVKFYFYGSSKKRYVCTMDFKGNFVEKPTEI